MPGPGVIASSVAAKRKVAKLMGGGFGAGDGRARASRRPVDRRELVAVRIAHVGHVQRAWLAVARAGCTLDRRAALRDRRVVELLQLFGRLALEADGAAVGMGRRLAVDRLRHAEGAAVVA